MARTVATHRKRSRAPTVLPVSPVLATPKAFAFTTEEEVRSCIICASNVPRGVLVCCGNDDAEHGVCIICVAKTLAGDTLSIDAFVDVLRGHRCLVNLPSCTAPTESAPDDIISALTALNSMVFSFRLSLARTSPSPGGHVFGTSRTASNWLRELIEQPTKTPPDVVLKALDYSPDLAATSRLSTMLNCAMPIYHVFVPRLPDSHDPDHDRIDIQPPHFRAPDPPGSTLSFATRMGLFPPSAVRPFLHVVTGSSPKAIWCVTCGFLPDTPETRTAHSVCAMVYGTIRGALRSRNLSVSSGTFLQPPSGLPAIVEPELLLNTLLGMTKYLPCPVGCGAKLLHSAQCNTLTCPKCRHICCALCLQFLTTTQSARPVHMANSPEVALRCMHTHRTSSRRCAIYGSMYTPLMAHLPTFADGTLLQSAEDLRVEAAEALANAANPDFVAPEDREGEMAAQPGRDEHALMTEFLRCSSVVVALLKTLSIETLAAAMTYEPLADWWKEMNRGCAWPMLHPLVFYAGAATVGNITLRRIASKWAVVTNDGVVFCPTTRLGPEHAVSVAELDWDCNVIETLVRATPAGIQPRVRPSLESLAAASAPVPEEEEEGGGGAVAGDARAGVAMVPARAVATQARAAREAIGRIDAIAEEAGGADGSAPPTRRRRLAATTADARRREALEALSEGEDDDGEDDDGEDDEEYDGAGDDVPFDADADEEDDEDDEVPPPPPPQHIIGQVRRVISLASQRRHRSGVLARSEEVMPGVRRVSASAVASTMVGRRTGRRGNQLRTSWLRQ